MLRKIFLTGIGFFAVLFIYAVLFYKERVLFSDASYYLFSIIKDRSFFIQHQRFGVAFSEVPAVLASRAGMPVAQIALLYSLGFIFFHFVVYLVTGFILKAYDWALLILLGLSLYISDQFFAPQSELVSGFSFFCLFMALLKKSKKVRHLLLTVILCIPFIVFFHPLMLFILLYAASFFYLEKDGVFTKRQLFFAIGSYFVILGIKLVFFKDKYESETTGLGYLLKLFPNYCTPALGKFLTDCLTKYCWIGIVFILVIVSYCRRRQWGKLILSAGASIGYILLVHITHPFDEGLAFYIENLYMPLVAFMGLPFVFDVVPRYGAQPATLVMGLMLLSAVARIYVTHEKYTVRLNWQREYLNDHRHEKLLVDSRTVPNDTLMLSWASPFEFCLLSTIEYDATASINFHDNPDYFSYILHEPKVFLHAWGDVPYSSLPEGRFKFKDSVSVYRVVK
jgi:hypothetical protein